MSFLAPLFFLGALALAAPVIFHLIRRTTRDRVPFSSLMFLRPSPPRLTRKSRLEHLLLLLLRCLALALVAFAFARPFVKEAVVAEVDAGAARRVVVLVDISASMQREGLWAAAQARVDAVLRGTGPADSVALLTFGREVSSLMTFEDWANTPPDQRIAAANGRLAAVKPGWGGSQLGGALALAADLLGEVAEAGEQGRLEVVAVGDLQSGSRLEALQSLEWPRGVRLLLEPVSARAATNASLQVLADAADVERTGDPVVRVRVSNAAESGRERFQVGWRGADGQPAGAPVETYVPPGQSRVVALPVPETATPPTEIVLTGDDEPFDNRVYVIPRRPQTLSVAYLGGEAAGDTRSPRFFLERALAATPRLEVNVSAVGPAAPWTPAAQADASLVVVTDPLPPARADDVRALALAGKTVLVAPKGVEVAPTLARLLGVDSVAMEEALPPRYAMLGEIDFRHPLFLPFADPRFSDFTKIHFWRYRRIDASAWPDARVLARFDSRDPALLEVPLGTGRLVVLASGWSPADSQLAVSSKFVPLLYSMLELAGGVTAPATTFIVGDTPPRPEASGPVSLRSPDGTEAALSDAGARLPALALPGVYSLLAGGETAARFAVNLDPAESRTAPLAVEEFERLGAPVAVEAADPVRAEEQKIVLRGMETESRQKLWRWFIAATLLVLLFESIMAGRAARKTAVPGSVAS
jgi:hypothetical protein